MGETKNKMLQRCWGWDYKAPCIYLITIVIADRRSMALGRLVVDNDGGGDPAKVMAHVEPSAPGRAVEAEWRRMGELTPAIKPLAIQMVVEVTLTPAQQNNSGGSVASALAGACPQRRIETETGEFREKLAVLLAMAAKGAVLISPCISDGEREIARRVMEMIDRLAHARMSVV